MSFNPLVCEDCNTECVFEQIGLFPSEENISTFGVSWKCPKCSKLSLDMCVFGPNVPQKNACSNCLEPYQDNTCQGCGLTKTEEDEFFNAYSSKDEAVKDLYNLFNKGLARRAILIANRILSEDISSEEAWKFKATALNFLKLNEQRVNLLKDALAAGAPKNLLISYGRALHELNRPKEAIEAYDKYLSLQDAKKKAVVLAHKANALIDLESYNEAENFFLAAIEADPKRVESYNDYINLLEDLENWEKSLEMIDKLLKLSLTDKQINSLLEEKSYIYAEKEEGEEALRFAETVLEKDQKSVRAHYLRGRALALLGKLEESKDVMKVVLELHPNHEDAVNAIGMIDEALAKTRPKNWKLI